MSDPRYCLALSARGYWCTQYVGHDDRDHVATAGALGEVDRWPNVPEPCGCGVRAMPSTRDAERCHHCGGTLTAPRSPSPARLTGGAA